MTLFDGIIIGVALLSALMGLIRGLTREVLGLASWIGGASLTFIGMPFVQIIARRYIQNGMMADVAAAVGLFLIFLILFSVISHTLSGFIRQSVLGGIDRSLGFLFGIGRGIVVLCVFQLLISCFVPRQKQPENFQNNRFAPMIYKGSDLIFSLLPHQIASKIFEQQQKLVSDISAIGTTANMANTMNAVVNNAAGFATPGQMANNLKQQSPSSQQEAENLARLQPRATVPTEGASVTTKQQNDMNRFLNLQDVDEESALEAESQEEIAPAPMAAMAPTMMPQQQMRPQQQPQQPMMPRQPAMQQNVQQPMQQPAQQMMTQQVPQPQMQQQQQIQQSPRR
jgi:membrane protein required for colicin V production